MIDPCPGADPALRGFVFLLHSAHLHPSPPQCAHWSTSPKGRGLPSPLCFRRTLRRGVRGNLRDFPLRFPGDFGHFWRPKVPHRCRTRRRPALSFVRSTPPVFLLRRPRTPSPSRFARHLSQGERLAAGESVGSVKSILLTLLNENDKILTKKVSLERNRGIVIAFR